MKTKTVRAMAGTAMTAANRSGPTGAFCAVGNPQSFFQHLRRDGFQLVFTRAFPDHHVYSRADLNELVRDAKKQGATKLLTTAKDAVKLQSFVLEIDCQVLEIEVSIDHEERFIALLQKAISK
jgi:tetraacyldisaccharide 4'-kinase